MKLISKLTIVALCAALVIPSFAAPAKTKKPMGKMAGHAKMGKMTGHTKTVKGKGKAKGHAKTGKMTGHAKMGKMTMGGKKKGK